MLAGMTHFGVKDPVGFVLYHVVQIPAFGAQHSPIDRMFFVPFQL
jgi:hypothetical protein